MGYPGFVHPPDEEQPLSPVLPQPQASGGGFWSTVVDLLRNVPITIGSPRQGRIQLPSYNQLTAGRRLLDYGRGQGLDLPQVGSVSPGEAQFMVEQGLQRRQQAPIGMDVAQRLMPPLAGEPPDVTHEQPDIMQQRAWLAQLPRSELGPLLRQHVTTYGLPGWGGQQTLDPYAAVRYLPTDEAPPSGAPSPAPSAALPQPGALPSGGEGAPSPVAPSTAPLAAAPAPSLAAGPAPGLPQAPSPPTGRVTQAQVLQHPTVTAAQAAYAASRTLQERRQNALALRNALQQAPYKIQQEAHQRYGERSTDYRNQLQTLQTQRQLQAQSYTQNPELDYQLRVDHNLPPGVPPTSDQLAVSHPRMIARQAEEQARKAALAETTKTHAQHAAHRALPLREYYRQPAAGRAWDSRGQRVPMGRNAGETFDQEARGEVTFLDPQDDLRMGNMREAADIARQGKEKLTRLYAIVDEYKAKLPMTAEERADPLLWLNNYWAQIIQEHPELVQTQRFFASNIQPLARGLYRGKGDLNQSEFASAMSAVPQLEARLSALGRLGLPGYVSIPIGTPQAPDTKEVALATWDTTMETINRNAATLLQRPGFQFEGVTPRTPEEVAQGRAAAKAKAAEVKEAHRQQTGLPTTLKEVEERLVPAPLKPAYEKGKALLKPAPTAATPVVRAKQTALRAMGVTREPQPGQDPAAFQEYLTTFRTHVGNAMQQASPAELDQLTQEYAKRLGGTWQPPQR